MAASFDLAPPPATLAGGGVAVPIDISAIDARLIWDQYTVTWEVTITGTTVAHTLITNGALTTVGPHHWSVAFPDAPA